MVLSKTLRLDFTFAFTFKGSIEKKISSLMNLQRLREIQDSVVWPVLGDNEKKSEIPDVRRKLILVVQFNVLIIYIAMHEFCVHFISL